MPIRFDVTAKAANGTLDYVQTDRVPQGEIWCLQGIAYENETGARGTFRRGVERNGQYVWYAEHSTPGAGELVFTDKILYLIPGERLVLRQATCTANDILHLYAHGYKVHGAFLPGGE
jgi:hypothetical protein